MKTLHFPLLASSSTNIAMTISVIVYLTTIALAEGGKPDDNENTLEFRTSTQTSVQPTALLNQNATAPRINILDSAQPTNVSKDGGGDALFENEGNEDFDHHNVSDQHLEMWGPPADNNGSLSENGTVHHNLSDQHLEMWGPSADNDGSLSENVSINETVHHNSSDHQLEVIGSPVTVEQWSEHEQNGSLHHNVSGQQLAATTQSPQGNDDEKEATVPPEVVTDTPYIEDIHDRCSAKLYSCRGRCNTAPRLACSCHMTCKVYGNCCEDFEDACPALVLRQEQKYGTLLPVDIECVGNNFLIASCKSEMQGSNALIGEGQNGGSGISAANITISGGDAGLARIFEDLGAEDISARCYSPPSESDDPLQHAPVTDANTRLHFKNIFCAVCSGVLDLELWHGLTHCKHGNLSNATTSVIIRGSEVPVPTSNRTILPNVEVTRLISSEKCETFWRPKMNSGDKINPCLHQADTTSHSASSPAGDEVMVRTHQTVTTEEIDETALEEQISEKYSSLHLEWRNVSRALGDVFNQSYFQEKCETLNSFVEHPEDSASRYKNKYCFMLDSRSASTNKFCEPSLAIRDDGGYWYTLSMADEKPQGVTTAGNGQDASARWVVYEGIEEPFWDDLVSDESLSRCDGKRALVLEGKCRSKSFYLTMKTNFTFVRSSLIRGDFNAQVDKFTDLLVDTFVAKVSNTTACVVVSYEHSKTPGSSVKFQSHAEFQCLDILDTGLDGDLSVVTPANLKDGGSIGNYDVNHYIMFVTNTLKIVVEKEKAVTLPVTIELTPCIFPDKEADGKFRGYCTKVTNVWRATRKMNTIIGGLSLEGILTIVCCILSVVGLIIRLALQNVVPFYKSYPGKIQFGLCLSLFLAYALFMLGGLVDEGSTTCMVFAIFTHVAFLSALFWMNVTAFEIWRTFRTWRNQVVSRGHASLILSVFYAVGIPVAIMITALLVEEFRPHSKFSPSYGEHDCWLNGSMAVAFYFVTPCCIICCVNAIFVGLTLRSLRRQRTSISEFKKSNATTAVTDVGIVIKIILLVGITWLLGLLAALVDNEWLWILFTVINASLGFLISVVLVFNKRVYYTVRAKCLCYNNDTISVVSTQVQRH